MARRRRAAGRRVDELVPFPGAAGIPERPRRHLPAAGRSSSPRAGRRFDLALQVYGDNPAANAVTAAPRRPAGRRLRARRAGTAAADPALHLPYPPPSTRSRRHLRLLEHLGLPLRAGARALELPLTAARRRPAHAVRCATSGWRRAATPCCTPGASSPSRRWPVARSPRSPTGWPRPGSRRRGRRRRRAGPRRRARRGRRRVPVARPHAAAPTWGPTPPLLRDAAVLVGNDTGTAHLAAAVGGAGVTLFLSGDPRRWALPRAAGPGPAPDVAVHPVPAPGLPHRLPLLAVHHTRPLQGRRGRARPRRLMTRRRARGRCASASSPTRRPGVAPRSGSPTTSDGPSSRGRGLAGLRRTGRRPVRHLGRPPSGPAGGPAGPARGRGAVHGGGAAQAQAPTSCT